MYRIYIIISILFLCPLFSQGQDNVIAENDTIKVELDEVVIYSFREGSEVKKLPASTSLVGLNQINQNRIESIKDLTSFVPNFFMPEYGSQLTSPVFIRGIGSRINSPSVGLYVDYIPYFDKASFDFDLFDVHHIEVLRGPQGTLYGRNTMGGIINVYSLSPFDYEGTRIALSGGNYKYGSVTASHYGKIGTRTGFSVAGNYQHKGGYYTNAFDNSTVGTRKIGSGKIRLAHRFSDALYTEVFAQYEHSEQNGYPYALIDRANPSNSIIIQNDTSLYNRDLLSAGALLEWNTSDIILRAVTGYSHLKDKQLVDQDYSPLSIALATQTQRQNMLSQEIILKSNTDADYQWLLGAFGFYQQTDLNVFLDFKEDAPSLGMPLVYNDMVYDQPTYGWAVFHQSKWNNLLFDGLSFAAGLRIDGEYSKTNYTQTITMKQNGRQIITNPFIPELSYTQALPKATLNYNISTLNSVYASVAKGYKTGGFNSAVEDLNDATFKPEYSWNYELGFKLDFLNSRLTAEGAVYYIDWRDQQIYQFNTNGVGSILRNAGESASKGAELSLRAIPFPRFITSLSYGYTHATFTDYVNVNPKTGVKTDYTGNYLPYVPRHTVSANAAYSLYFNGDIINEMTFNLQYTGTGGIHWDEANLERQDYYGLFNARVAFKKDNWGELGVWTQNIFDIKYQTFYFSALGNKYLQYGKPFLIGVDLKFTFN